MSLTQRRSSYHVLLFLRILDFPPHPKVCTNQRLSNKRMIVDDAQVN